MRCSFASRRAASPSAAGRASPGSRSSRRWRSRGMCFRFAVLAGSARGRADPAIWERADTDAPGTPARPRAIRRVRRLHRPAHARAPVESALPWLLTPAFAERVGARAQRDRSTSSPRARSAGGACCAQPTGSRRATTPRPRSAPTTSRSAWRRTSRARRASCPPTSTRRSGARSGRTPWARPSSRACARSRSGWPSGTSRRCRRAR